MPDVNHAMSSGQARSIKRRGDFLRAQFKKQCCNDEGEIEPQYLKGISSIQTKVSGTYVMKTGKNWQFHLGSLQRYQSDWQINISECRKLITYGQPFDQIKSDLYSREFLESFILKGNFLVTMHDESWLIFSSRDILSILEDSELIQWRVLETGRIKGDIARHNGKRTIFTIEYRAEKHKQSFVIGAHGGGAGAKLGEHLRELLLFNSISIDYESWNG